MPHLPLDFSKLHESLTTQGSPFFLIKLPLFLLLLLVVVVVLLLSTGVNLGPFHSKRSCAFCVLEGSYKQCGGDGYWKLALGTDPRRVSGRFLGFIATVLKRSKEWEVVLHFYFFGC
jgi:hypothetical protein